MKIKAAADCLWDEVSLGEVMLRLDPGEERIHTTRSFRAWEGGGEYNVARGLRRCFGLRTALVTAFALAPLLLEAERPGTEILHPVAVVIFSGLISSTLLDTFLTPALFWLFGRKDAERLLDDKRAEAF